MKNDNMELPKEKSQPMPNLSDYSILLYGREKIGKTTFCSQFPDAFFLMFEPGGKALSIYKQDIKSWVDFKKCLNLLSESKKFSTLVIDTVDIAYNMCNDFILAKLPIDYPSDENWSKGWKMIHQEFTRGMVKLLNLNRCVIFISHSVEREIKYRSGDSSHRIMPSMNKTARNILEPMVDIWAYYLHDNHKRYLQIVGDDDVSAGHRIENHFEEISKIFMGNSSEESYKNFIDSFENKKEITQKVRVKIKRRS